MASVETLDKALWSVAEDDSAMYDALALVRASFHYMNARINPPSSIHHLTVEGMQEHCRDGGEIWAVGRPLFGCMFLKPRGESLYLSKLAVQDGMRGQGVGRALVDHAERRALSLGLPALELETRVELTENHRVFSRFGFTIVATGTHAGFDQPTEFVLRKPISLPADN
ncbi:GNAT family N-acetyltransferase [uncultured Ruegeria sp.]|jgi:GNAT superfamily N-acetyltransferase|uniref:GNAT family N-acetyltransferase n=1 Tax=uncultured Ruegeria sp. TaxID=259304 RepID=UPI002602B85E|nr:GNAT family N-acetyltransferase [uncultured Ruegeria sp.]